ncbi:MAG: hypothetical protein ACRYFS_24600 [Janthinobacterium lividum]
MTREMIREIEAELAAGDTPEEVGARREMTRTQLVYGLLLSGKRIVSKTVRRLVDAAPITTGDDAALSAAD